MVDRLSYRALLSLPFPEEASFDGVRNVEILIPIDTVRSRNKTFDMSLKFLEKRNGEFETIEQLSIGFDVPNKLGLKFT